MSNKKQLGQFYSTNSDVLLTDFIPEKEILEPFCGNGDLIKWAEKKYSELTYLAYDIEPPKKLKYTCVTQDTLTNPPNYKNKFVLTNPPYLAKNKNKNKKIYQYNLDDLYKVFIKQLIKGEAKGGIIIIPINFLSSTRKIDVELRSEFFSNYKIKQINIFLNPIFKDTTYSICCIWFEKSQEKLTKQNIIVWWRDENEYWEYEIQETYDWMIGGEIYYLPSKNKKSIMFSRLTAKETSLYTTYIFINGLDTRTERLSLKYEQFNKRRPR
jgi:hypothetical protein